MSNPPSTFLRNYGQPDQEAPPIVDYTPPDEVYAEIIKVQNRLKNLEKIIDQNQEKSKKLGTECVNIMGAAEIITFDLFLLDYIFNYGINANPFVTFVEQCDSAATKTEVEQLGGHIKYVYRSMETAVSNIMKNEIERIEPRSVRPLSQYVKLKEFMIGDEIQGKPVTTRLPTNVPQTPTPAINIPPEFDERIRKELEAAELSQEILHLRGVVGALSHKLADIDNIRAQIKALKPKVSDTKTFSIQDCPPESILNSPFYKVVEQKYHFLNMIAESLRKQTALIKSVNEELENSQNIFQKIKVTSIKMYDNFSYSKEKFVKRIDKLQNEILNLEQKYTPYIEAIFPKNVSARFQSMEEDNSKEWDEIAELLDQKLSATTEGTSENIDLSSAAVMLPQLRDMRDEIFQNCVKATEKARTWFYSQQANFSAIADSTKATVQIEELQNEYRELQKLQQIYLHFGDSYRSLSIEKICQNIIQANQQLIILATSSLDIPADTIQIPPAEDVEAEYAQLCAEEAALDEEIAKIDSQVREAEERRFVIAKERDMFKDMFTARMDRFDEREYENAKKILDCPVCKEAKRNVYLSPCMHAVCSDCLQKSGEVCPVCGHQVKETHPLYFQI
ncbi:hypothetical protein TVAG_076790 [Trichomonas vaginalis G3]|uniref:E3 ubiquitin protein ligase n=1 Tax=Trichomonas vaginalis (strain ATCC PRA-98 / G3) TaxID=412133 RepID=A2D9S6_TRIV3|nr:histone monoubiquitination [Trichomonas vaginalis G3]EAY22932.1 hypothetical protein TVAG_076790 [Trichomonas vaginalis G3]KAI5517796.1 histone monoubiquitination [Trichomonas vaginalis G3]|eukprot:XP_001583918.1 hypothetical protein [Trichomonas vaginalis G3]